MSTTIPQHAFPLSRQNLKLNNMNVRAELHGEDTKLAVDLAFELKTENHILDRLAPGLREALYMKDDGTDPNGDLLSGQDGALTQVRFDSLEQPMRLGNEYSAHALRLHYGIDDSSDIVLGACTIDKFKCECQPGGTVSTTFRVIAHPTSEQVGRIGEHLQQTVTVSIEPPTVDGMDEDGDE